MITDIDMLSGDEFRKACADFRVLLIKFAKDHDMSQAAAKQFIANLGGSYSWKLEHKCTTI